MELIIAFIVLYLALLTADLLWSSKKDKFLEEEADRCLNRHCEIDENWSSRGYPTVLSAGIALIQDKDDKKRFIKTKKLFYSIDEC